MHCLRSRTLRTLLGTMAWIAKETRADIAGEVALIQQSFPRPMVKDIDLANLAAKELLQDTQWIRHHRVPRLTAFRSIRQQLQRGWTGTNSRLIGSLNSIRTAIRSSLMMNGGAP